VVLGAIAARTNRIHLGSAVTVLSSDESGSVFPALSTLDAISNGRAEVILGRGSSIESFPLFGYDLADYEELFERRPRCSRSCSRAAPSPAGQDPAALVDQEVVPYTESGPFPVWNRVGGSPQSVIRALGTGSRDVAIIGGPPARSRPSVSSSNSPGALRRAPLPVGCTRRARRGHDEQAREEFWPHFLEVIRVSLDPRVRRTDKESFAHELGRTARLRRLPETVAQRSQRT